MTAEKRKCLPTHSHHDIQLGLSYSDFLALLSHAGASTSTLQLPEDGNNLDSSLLFTTSDLNQQNQTDANKSPPMKAVGGCVYQWYRGKRKLHPVQQDKQHDVNVEDDIQWT